MREHLHVSTSARGFSYSIPPPKRDPHGDVVMLAPGQGVWQRIPGLIHRLDWTAIGAGAFIYGIAFAAWLYVSK